MQLTHVEMLFHFQLCYSKHYLKLHLKKMLKSWVAVKILSIFEDWLKSFFS